MGPRTSVTFQPTLVSIDDADGNTKARKDQRLLQSAVIGCAKDGLTNDQELCKNQLGDNYSTISGWKADTIECQASNGIATKDNKSYFAYMLVCSGNKTLSSSIRP